MYKIIIKEEAIEDIKNITDYISNKLNNKSAAKKLINNIKNEVKNIKLFPYSNPQYLPLKKLSKKYRKSVIKNYVLLYAIDEDKQEIEVMRVLHNKQNIESIIHRVFNR